MGDSQFTRERGEVNPESWTQLKGSLQSRNLNGYRMNQSVCDLLGVFNHQPYSGRVIAFLLSLLSPVLSLKNSPQLVANQSFADFSDSSDSKNRQKHSYRVYYNRTPTFARFNRFRPSDRRDGGLHRR